VTLEELSACDRDCGFGLLGFGSALVRLKKNDPSGEKLTRSNLSAEELRDAGLKSLENASELIKEARILYQTRFLE